MGTKWEMEGTLLGGCSCDWGCPCSFDAPPTQGFCEGGYVWQVDRGHFGDTSLDGVAFAWLGHSPGALHKGNVTWVVVCDEKINEAQRGALARIYEGKSGGPWTIFMAVASKRTGPYFTPFEARIDGIHSKVSFAGMYDLELGPILNPVTGTPEEIYVDKPTGFTSKRLTMGTTRMMRVSTDVAYDHTGKYAEYSRFAYSGESPD